MAATTMHLEPTEAIYDWGFLYLKTKKQKEKYTSLP